MKQVLIFSSILLISCIAFMPKGSAQQMDTLITERVVFDTVITYTVTKRIMYDTTFIKTEYATGQTVTKTDVEEPVTDIKETPAEAVDTVVSDITEAPSEEPTPEKIKATYDFPIVDEASELAATIDAADLRKYLTELASDEYEGRETGSRGLQKAARYIAARYQEFGIGGLEKLDNGFFQPVPMLSEQWDNPQLVVGGKEFKFAKDWYAFTRSQLSRRTFERDEVVYLGWGIDDEDYSDYDKVDVKNKVILIYTGEPLDKDSISYITGTKKLSKWSTDWKKKLRAAKKKGVKCVIFIEPNTAFYINRYARYLTEPNIKLADNDRGRLYANAMYVSRDVAKEIIGSEKSLAKIIKAREGTRKTGKAKSVRLKTNLSITLTEEKKELQTSNVIGFIEGSDPKLKKEIVVISAHYDHLGKRGDNIFNGADDNGSGSATLIEIAEAFAQAKKDGKGPRRSIVVMHLTGEEKGLLGSAYYVDNPVFEIDRHMVNLNVDMIGRPDKDHPDPNYIYVIGADRLSTELHEANEAANKKYTNINLDYTYNAEDDPNQFYYRSDHYNFAKNGIPAAFYFSGVHDDYHRPTDTYEKIDFERMAQIGRLVFLTAYDLANRDKSIEVDEDKRK